LILVVKVKEIVLAVIGPIDSKVAEIKNGIEEARRVQTEKEKNRRIAIPERVRNVEGYGALESFHYSLDQLERQAAARPLSL
jgi:hypothetical protein